MKKGTKIAAGVAAGVLGIAVVGGVAAGGDDSKPVQASNTEVVEAKAEANASQPQPEPSMTKSQENAVKSAESYLDLMGFSRSGLIKQLEFEGYSTKDATFAVVHISPNWNAEAAEKAKSYLDTQAFSRSGLIDQLKFEGFTQAQAEYGVKQTGL
jgi:hypothetical protein